MVCELVWTCKVFSAEDFCHLPIITFAKLERKKTSFPLDGVDHILCSFAAVEYLELGVTLQKIMPAILL